MTTRWIVSAVIAGALWMTACTASHQGSVPTSESVAHHDGAPSASDSGLDSAASPYRDLDALAEGTIVHVPSGVELSREQLLDVLSAARVVYVGESHDNVRHHRIQLDILRALADRFPGQVAVGMEMLQRPSQPQIDRWIRGELSDKEFQSLWYENWTADYAYYRPILDFVRERRIPLLALNISERTARALSSGQADALSPEERAELPEIDTTDPYHRRQMEAVFGGHAHGAGFDPFYRTMLLWDETMADSVARYIATAPAQSQRLVVFAGGGHIAYGFGIPRRAFRRVPVPYVTVLPHTDVSEAPPDRPDVVMHVDPFTVPLPYADIVWITGYEDLPAPSVRLGVRVDAAEAGVVVTQVAPESAAHRAGLREDDLITKFDEESVRRPADLVRMVREHAPGDRVRLEIKRAGSSLTLDVVWPE